MRILLIISLCGVLTAYAQTCPNGLGKDTPDSRFSPSNFGYAVDNQTGLVWMRCALGQTFNNANGSCDGDATLYSWQQALAAAKTLNDNGGFSSQRDWRVPNVKELMSIVEFGCNDPAVNANVFPNTLSEKYWSSTTYTLLPNNAWAPNFVSGSQFTADKQTNQFPVRLVRGGQ